MILDEMLAETRRTVAAAKRDRPIEGLERVMRRSPSAGWIRQDADARGADAILPIVAALGDDELRSCLGEARRLGLGVLVGVNHRDLRTFEMDMDPESALPSPWPACERRTSTPYWWVRT